VRRILCATLFVMLLAAVHGFAAEPAGLTQVSWLLGEWKGQGEGQAGHSASERHAEMVLGHFVRVAGRSVYPKQEKNPNGEIHEQTDMWSYDRARKVLILRQ
jgi:hypothetical protein